MEYFCILRNALLHGSCCPCNIATISIYFMLTLKYTHWNYLTGYMTFYSTNIIIIIIRI